MSPERFRVLIEGVVAIWQVEANLAFEQDSTGCRITLSDGGVVMVGVEQQAFGPVWRISRPEQRERSHASVVTALRGLRAILCPDRPTGRAWFVPEA